ncbi:PAS domain-containing protein [Jannaschia seohaensis]|uniref:histidine kinase n=1 Tax=Jannaschia seohaensis TaxID=475081 RepID=A0A2Y9AMJ6_9RHOB|nr:PAS domain-containing protein [Jannaschia seohaensis]PWJ20492.1 PAS domain S-box-containing protein [Jannaschia seohaensis]SSA44588.1 PAS domain S-box-containing protein [Jannaschia seohaensis]
MGHRLHDDLRHLTQQLYHASDSIQLVDPDGRILWLNQQSVDQLGLPFDAAGSMLSAHWPDDESRMIRDALQKRPRAATHFTARRQAGDGSSAWWDVAVVPVSFLDGKRCHFVVTCHDVTRRETRNSARDILLEEMRHRQGNTLALASTLMALHARGQPELDVFVDEMGKRLAAMGRAQAIVARQTASDDRVTELSGLLETLVRPLVGPACDLVIDVEPNVTLPADKIDVVGMVLSELAVNSAKHGAFLHGGRLALSVFRTDDGIEFAWQERSNEDVSAHHRKGGLGQTLMDRFASVNDGNFDVTWRPRGQTARLILRDVGLDVPAA